MISVSLLNISRKNKKFCFLCKVLQESLHMEPHLSSIIYDVQINNEVIRVGKYAASKISSAHMRSNNQYLLETQPQK